MRIFKTCLTLFAAAGVLAAVLLLRNNLLFSGGENYTFYVGDSSSNCRIVTSDNPALEKLTLSDVRGECAHFNDVDAEQLIYALGGNIEFVEQLDDSVNYYCSAPLPYAVTLYGKTINLHVSVRADGVTVASPIIFGGY